MTITLSPKLAKFVKAQLASGRYSSAAAVVGDALQLLQYSNRTDEEKLADLRREIDIGIQEIERGEYVEFDEALVEEICRAGRERQKRRMRKQKKKSA